MYVYKCINLMEYSCRFWTNCETAEYIRSDDYMADFDIFFCDNLYIFYCSVSTDLILIKTCTSESAPPFHCELVYYISIVALLSTSSDKMCRSLQLSMTVL